MSDIMPYNQENRGLYNFFDNFFNDFMPVKSMPLNSFKLDVKEEDNGYIVDAELAGVKKEDVSISYANDTLCITVETKNEKEEKKEKYIHKERSYGSCCRSVHLGGVDEDNISASFSEGLLTISLPKEKEGRRSKNIDIK